MRQQSEQRTVVEQPDARCAECGQLIGGSGVCTSCLLRAGLDEEELFSPMRFGDFEILVNNDGTLCELGRGAMAVTYRAHDKVLNRTVALKVIETANSQLVRERFLREARTAAALRHPNIAAVYQFGVSSDGGRCYCAMELVEGETLEALVRRNGPLEVKLVLEIAIQVTRALLAAADRGLVHRDLKPGNIMLSRDQTDSALCIKVIDFGLAKAMRGAGEMELTHGNFVGTPAFASPEQFAHGAIDARTDIYALGVTMWFALTGRLPFAGTSIEEIREKQAEGSLPNEQLRLRRVPPPLTDLLQSCLANEPMQRPASAHELMSALEACRARTSRPRLRWRLALAGIAAVLLALGLAGFFLRQPRVPEARDSAHLEDASAPPKITDSSEAYLLFLRAQETEAQSHGVPKEVLQLYEQAIAVDPKFAFARARFSIVASEHARQTVSAEWRKRARTEAEAAIHLQPDLGVGHLALAKCYIYEDNDASRALAELNRAATLLPNSAEVQLLAASAHKLQNKYRERIAALRRAEAIDWRMGAVRNLLTLTLAWVREWNEAIEAFDRAATVSYNEGTWEFVSPWCRALLGFRGSGRIDVLREALQKEEEKNDNPAARLACERFELAMLERDYAGAAKALSEAPADELAGRTINGVTTHEKLFHGPLFDAALLSILNADPDRPEIVRRAAEDLEAQSRVIEKNWSTQPLADLAVLHAFAGEKEQAITEINRAISLCGTGSIESNSMSSALALVYARTGEAEKALDLIEHLLTVPCDIGWRVYDMTLADLKWRWVWDPLRSNPRFQKLLAGPEPKTIY